MVRFRALFCVSAVAALAITGCSGHDDTLSVSGAGEHSETAFVPGPALNVTSSASINGYDLQFDGRQYSGGYTTFYYTVSWAGGEHALSHFALELPGCAPPLYSSTPAGGVVGVNPHTGLNSVKWDLKLELNASRSYSITFAGDVSPLNSL